MIKMQQQESNLKTSREYLLEYFDELKAEIDYQYAVKIQLSNDFNTNKQFKDMLSSKWQQIIQHIDTLQMQCLKDQLKTKSSDELIKTIHVLKQKIQNSNLISNELKYELKNLEYKLRKNLFGNKTILFIKSTEELEFLSIGEHHVGVLLIIFGDYFTQEELYDNIISCNIESHLIMLDHLKKKLFNLIPLTNGIYEIVFDKFEYRSLKLINNYLTIKNFNQEYLINFKNLKSIIFTDYSCVNIEANAFEDLFLLEELSLSLNNLTKLDQNLFSSLTNLIKLDLSRNKFYLLDKDLFSQLEKLEELNLSRNYLLHLDAEIFRNCFSLKNLNLARNNLNSLDKYIFENLQSLEDVDLSENNLTEFDQKLNCSNLKYLNLADNRLKSIDKESFIQLVNLNWINLSGNLLKEIDTNTFKNCTQLDHLNLAMNQLKSVNLNFFPHVRFSIALFRDEFFKMKNNLFVKNRNLKSVIVIDPIRDPPFYVYNREENSRRCTIL